MTLDQLKESIAEILEVNASAITNETSDENLDSWDSMATLRIISFLDEQLDTQVEPDDAQALDNFGAIVQFASDKGILQ